jgi:hypothetical protein
LLNASNMRSISAALLLIAACSDDPTGIEPVTSGTYQAEITQPLNTLNCLLQDIWVAPHSEGTVSGTCTAPFDLDLVVLSSHAHQRLRRFEIVHGVDLIYESRDWDSPAIKTLEHPLSLAQGDGLTFKCTFKNDGDQWIVFGTGDYGEMCVIYRDGHSAPLVETTDIDGPF